MNRSPAPHPHKAKPALSAWQQGFTILEMLLVVIVLAILVTITTPSLYQFFRQRDVQNEENTQQEIRRALQAFTAQNNALPDPSTWSTDLAGFSNLSAAQIGKDIWSTSRSLIIYTDNTRSIQGSPVPILYASVISAGPDRKASATTGIAVNVTDFDNTAAANWWSNQSNPVNTFGTMRPAGDDIMVKFTDFSEKLDRYQQTIDRLQRISEALEIYAKTGYANQVAICSGATTSNTAPCTTPGAIENMIYYPKSRAVNSTTDNATYSSSTEILNNGGTVTERRDGAIRLMRVLGLPDEFCCSAVNMITTGSSTIPSPFFYFSNPRPRTAVGGCGSRPVSSSIKLPARLTGDNNDSPANGAVPTCG